MLMLGSIGLLLLGAGNVFLVYAEETVPSGFSSLVFAVIPLYVACIEMVLPNGEPLPRRGWLGLLLGFAGLAALVVAFAAHGSWRQSDAFVGDPCAIRRSVLLDGWQRAVAARTP